MKWSYKKYNEETGSVERAPLNDIDGTITGKYILNLSAWLDENPDEAKRLGYVKIYEDEESVEYNKQTQFLTTSLEKVDDYTYRTVYNVFDKSEEMLFYEDLDSVRGLSNTFLINGHI